MERWSGILAAHLPINVANLQLFGLDLVLQLGDVVLQFVQIVCLDLQILIDLVRFLLKQAILLSDLL